VGSAPDQPCRRPVEHRLALPEGELHGQLDGRCRPHPGQHERGRPDGDGLRLRRRRYGERVAALPAGQRQQAGGRSRLHLRRCRLRRPDHPADHGGLRRGRLRLHRPAVRGNPGLCRRQRHDRLLQFPAHRGGGWHFVVDQLAARDQRRQQRHHLLLRLHPAATTFATTRLRTRSASTATPSTSRTCRFTRRRLRSTRLPRSASTPTSTTTPSSTSTSTALFGRRHSSRCAERRTRASTTTPSPATTIRSVCSTCFGRAWRTRM